MINKDDSEKFTHRKTLLFQVRFCKRESTKYRMLVLFVLYCNMFGKFAQGINIEKGIGQSMTVFHKPQRRMTRIKRER